MKHLVYKTYNPSTGEYYFGKHSTDNLNDGYKGSGNWIKESEKDTLVTETLDIVETELEAYELQANRADGRAWVKVHRMNALNAYQQAGRHASLDRYLKTGTFTT